MKIVNTYDDLKKELKKYGYLYLRMNKSSNEKLEELGREHSLIFKSYYDNVVEKIKNIIIKELNNIGFIYNSFYNSELSELLETAFKDFNITTDDKIKIISNVLNDYFESVILDNNDIIYYLDKKKAYSKYIATYDFFIEEKNNIKKYFY